MHVRPSWKPSLEEALPYDARSLLAAYRCAPRCQEFYFEVPLAPPSVNNIYRKWHSKKTNKTGYALEDSVVAYRQLTKVVLARRAFAPRGVVAVVIAIESPRWVTAEHKVRKQDVDNPIKAVLDALTHSISLADENVWSVFDTKIFSRREATHVWMFDLGDIVTAVGGATNN